MTARAPIGFVLETMLLNMNEGNAVCDPRAIRQAIETLDELLGLAEQSLVYANMATDEPEMAAYRAKLRAAIAMAKGPQS